MDYLTKIDPAFLDKLNDFDRERYEETIGQYGVWGYLQQQEVALKGHFVFSVGGHGNVYVNIRDLNDPAKLCPLAMQMAWDCRDMKLDGICGTPHGADTLASYVAYYYTLFTGIAVEVLKPLKGPRGLVWYKDHGDRVKGMRVLQIEDVVNSSTSLRETADFVLTSGGNYVGFVAACFRLSEKNPGISALRDEYCIDFAHTLTDVSVENHSVDISRDPREQCPYCAKGLPIDMRVGHGQKFLDQIGVAFPDFYRFITAR